MSAPICPTTHPMSDATGPRVVKHQAERAAGSVGPEGHGVESVAPVLTAWASLGSESGGCRTVVVPLLHPRSA
jgi:hypothetical protein